MSGSAAAGIGVLLLLLCVFFAYNRVRDLKDRRQLRLEAAAKEK
jgi:hypothetical protein